jgi:hypothetical protein
MSKAFRVPNNGKGLFEETGPYLNEAKLLWRLMGQGSGKIDVLKIIKIGLFHRPDDYLARFDVHAADPLTRIHHEPFGDYIDAPPVEISNP